MLNKVLFSKYSGAGNDFILLNNLKGTLPSLGKPIIRNLCHRNHGVGADGIVVATPSKKGDAKIHIWNSDGSEADMCGNGLRCFVLFLHEIGIQKTDYLIESKHFLHRCSYTSGVVTTEIAPPTKLELHRECGLASPVHTLNIGIPHLVSFHEDVATLDVANLGPKICDAPHFSPGGINVNFVRLKPNRSLEIRTYERGVGAETLACGTGSTAAALVGARLFSLPSPITVITRSKQTLTVSFTQKKNTFKECFLTGPGTKTFEGALYLKGV